MTVNSGLMRKSSRFEQCPALQFVPVTRPSDLRSRHGLTGGIPMHLPPKRETQAGARDASHEVPEVAEGRRTCLAVECRNCLICSTFKWFVS